MKQCILCSTDAADSDETCLSCGEASWSDVVIDAKGDEPKQDDKPSKKLKKAN